MEQETKLYAVKGLSGDGEGGANGDNSVEGAGTAQVRGDAATPAQEQSATHTGDSADELQQQVAPRLKHPIFIGCLEPDIVKAIEKFLFEGDRVELIEGDKRTDWPEMPSLLSKDEYTLFVINPTVYQGLYQQFLFSELSKEEQERQKQALQTKAVRDAAISQALQMQYKIGLHRTRNAQLKEYYEQHPEEAFVFTFTELKTIMRAHQEFKKGEKRKLLTNQDIWNLMDLVMLNGYMTKLDDEANKNVRKELVRYQLTITPADHAALAKRQVAHKRQQLAQQQEELQQWEARAEQLEREAAEAAKPKAAAPAVVQS